MNFSTQFLVATAGIVLSLSAVCGPLVVSGVRFDDSINVNENPIHLNGAGIRYKAIFKVYAAGL